MYVAPPNVTALSLGDLLRSSFPYASDSGQTELSLFGNASRLSVPVYYAGELSLLSRRCVSIIGSRQVSEIGAGQAKRLSEELTSSGFVVMSGLAAGVDTQAHTAAIGAGGRTVAVIGTPLDMAVPTENAGLQALIYREQLLISQFPTGAGVSERNFPRRNRLMAALSVASVIVEASDSSGALHQARECVRLKRWLFIPQTLIEDRSLTWPSRFLKYDRVRAFKITLDIAKMIGA